MEIYNPYTVQVQKYEFDENGVPISVKYRYIMLRFEVFNFAINLVMTGIMIASFSFALTGYIYGVNLRNPDAINFTCPTPAIPTCPTYQCASAADVGRLENILINNVVGASNRIERMSESLLNRPALCYQSGRVYGRVAAAYVEPIQFTNIDYRGRFLAVKYRIPTRESIALMPYPNFGFVRVEHFVTKFMVMSVAWLGRSNREITDIAITMTSQPESSSESGMDPGLSVTKHWRSTSRIISTYVGFGDRYGCVFISTLGISGRVLCMMSNSTDWFSNNLIDFEDDTVFFEGSGYWGDNADVILGNAAGGYLCNDPIPANRFKVQGMCYSIVVRQWTFGTLMPAEKPGQILAMHAWWDDPELSRLRHSENACFFEGRNTTRNKRTFFGLRNNITLVECANDETDCVMSGNFPTIRVSAAYANTLSAVVITKYQSADKVFAMGCTYGDEPKPLGLVGNDYALQ